MSDNQKVPFTELVIVDTPINIRVEKSLKEVEALINDEKPYLSIIAEDGLHYLIPKMTIKYVYSNLE